MGCHSRLSLSRLATPRIAARHSGVVTTKERLHQLVGPVDADLRRMADLVRQYADRRPGGTDASIGAGVRPDLDTVATANRRDFNNSRQQHRRAPAIVPERDQPMGRSRSAAITRRRHG